MQTQLRTLEQVNELLAEYQAERVAFEEQYKSISADTRESEVGKMLLESIQTYKGYCEELEAEKKILEQVKKQVGKKGVLKRIGGAMVIAAAYHESRKTRRNGGR